MFCIKTIEVEGGVKFEVNKMLNIDNFEPIKTFDSREDAHNYVIGLIQEYQNSLVPSLSN